MIENGENGMYMLKFKIEAVSGNIYVMGRNFFIASVEEEVT